MLLAKALYDNIAETPEELAFRRGDILTVVEQDTSGLDGWWLCSLNGRHGIAPGNRLRIVDKILVQKGTATSPSVRVDDITTPTACMKSWHQQNKVFSNYLPKGQ